MLDVTLEQLTYVLGEPSRHVGHQYYFRCPACAQHGGDTSCDNLLFNERKGLLKCFACDDGARYTLDLINKKAKHIKPTQRSSGIVSKLWWQENKNNLWQYWIEAHEEMTEDVRQWLNEQGVTNKTIQEWMIGFDGNPSIVKVGPCVCFPMISLYHDLQLVGFELRQVGDNKIIRHTYDSPKCLCVINSHTIATKLVICEGFKDAYSFMQIIDIRGQKEQFTILTPSHGVGSIIDCLGCIDFARYNQYFLLLDNDDAGDKVTEQIIKKYNLFKDSRKILKQYNDVNELWLGEYA